MPYADATHHLLPQHHATHTPTPDATAAELAEAVAAMHFTGDTSPLCLLRDTSHGLPSRRRARSLSPQRRSPKLRHTNGRLDADPLEETAGEDGDACALLSEKELLRVIQLNTQTQRSSSSTTDSSSKRTMRQRRESNSFPARKDVRRSSSCLEAGDFGVSEDSAATTRRFKIFYRDEALRESCAKNTRRMIENARLARGASPASPDAAAASPPSPQEQQQTQSAVPHNTSNQQQIARKALRFRKLLARTDEIDDSRLNDPSFDVLECLGVQWCKV